MWSNVISIDKGFRREIEFILGKLKNIRHLSYAVEESRDRVFVYIASVCEMQEEVEAQVRDVLQTVFLVFLKLRFFSLVIAEYGLEPRKLRADMLACAF